MVVKRRGIVERMKPGQSHFRYTGTLAEKVRALYHIHGKIQGIKQNPDTNPSGDLLTQRADMEMEINRHLVGGEKIQDPFLDYCIRNFNGGSYSESVKGGGSRQVISTVFDVMPKVDKFIQYVNGQVGNKVLSTYGKMPSEIGVISGPVGFYTERNFRYMHIPVESLLEFENGRWTESESEYGVLVNPELFKHPKSKLIILGASNTWETDHSGQMCRGGSGPKESGLYIGNRNVEKRLRRKLEEIVTVKTPIPNPNLD